jgi:hypothetical protein
MDTFHSHPWCISLIILLHSIADKRPQPLQIPSGRLAMEIGWETLVLKVRKRNKEREREKGKEMEWKLEERDEMGKEREGGVVKEGIRKKECERENED